MPSHRDDLIHRQQAGFSLLEMLVSATISVATLGVVYATVVAYQKTHFDLSARTRVENDVRAALDFIGRDLENAGFHLIGRGRFAHFGTVFPSLDAGDSFDPAVLTIWSNPDVAESPLSETMVDEWAPLLVDTVAGFEPEMEVWVIGACNAGEIRRDKFAVTAVDSETPPALHHAGGLSCRYQKGARVVRLRQVSFWLDPPVGGQSDLLRQVDEEAADVIASGMTRLQVTWFDGADPPAAFEPDDAAERREVRKLRVELAGESLEVARGSGIRQSAELSTEFAPRNLVLQESL